MGLIPAVLTVKVKESPAYRGLWTMVGPLLEGLLGPRALPGQTLSGASFLPAKVFLPERGSALCLPQESELLQAEVLVGKQWLPASQSNLAASEPLQTLHGLQPHPVSRAGHAQSPPTPPDLVFPTHHLKSSSLGTGNWMSAPGVQGSV